MLVVPARFSHSFLPIACDILPSRRRAGAPRPLDANLTRVTVLSASISVNRGNRPRAKRTLRLHCWTASFLVHAAYSFRF